MLKEFINKKLKETRMSATELCSQAGIPPSTYYLALKKNILNPDALSKIASILAVPLDEITSNANAPVKVRKPGKSKSAEILTQAVAKENSITKVKRSRKPGVIQPISVGVTNNELRMIKMELDYLKQMLMVKDELIDLLKQK